MVYINTAHPDFLNGQKAMAIVNERLTYGKVQAAERDLTRLSVAPQQQPGGPNIVRPGQPPNMQQQQMLMAQQQQMMMQQPQPTSVGPLHMPPSNSVRPPSGSIDGVPTRSTPTCGSNRAPSRAAVARRAPFADVWRQFGLFLELFRGQAAQGDVDPGRRRQAGAAAHYAQGVGQPLGPRAV